MASGLATRALSAVVLAVPVLAIVYVGSPLFGLLIMVAAGIMASEWYAMCAAGRWRIAGLVMAGSAMAAVAAMGLAEPGIALALLVAGSLTVLILSKGDRWLAGGVLYIGLPCVAVVTLRGDPEVGRETVFWLLGVVWASDIGAYLTGRTIGGPKLAPRISPGKTWAGFWGGIVSAGAVGCVFAAGIGLAQWWPLALVSGLLGGIAQGGDLFESWIKRRFGVKDTGSLIPGHGGLLDRVDALIAVILVTTIISTLTKGSMLQWL